jgi:hypothetical protein
MQLTPDQKYAEVPRTYFPQRRGNRVTLYHDAWQPIGPVPDVRGGGGGRSQGGIYFRTERHGGKEGRR